MSAVKGKPGVPEVDDHIIPRDLRFDIAGHTTRHWFANDPVRTAAIDALSIFLPQGERFFIRALKHYSAKHKDLAREINGYAVQEAYHTREHEEYNRALEALGYDVKEMERPVSMVLAKAESSLLRLAVTCAIEHLTATLSTAMLRKPDLFDGAAPAYRRLWMWHALEELEHKAVAIRVLKAATPTMPGWKRYLLRVTAMNATVIPFIWITLRSMRLFARRDGIRTGPRYWARLLYVLFVHPGFWRRAAGPYMRYYLPGFDAHNADDEALIARGRTWLAAELGPAAAAGKPL